MNADNVYSARCIVNGIAICVPFWVVVIAVIWAL